MSQTTAQLIAQAERLQQANREERAKTAQAYGLQSK